jgi:hypothetical protein
LGILIILNALFVVAISAFFLKRYQTYQRQKRTQPKLEE